MRVQKNKVLCLLGITAEAYDHYLNEMAIEFLLDHLGGDTLDVDDVLQCQNFSSWWQLQAHHRDTEWISSMGYAIAGKFEAARLLNDWLYYHSALRLLDMNNQHAQILYNSYANINFYPNASHN